MTKIFPGVDDVGKHRSLLWATGPASVGSGFPSRTYCSVGRDGLPQQQSGKRTSKKPCFGASAQLGAQENQKFDPVLSWRWQSQCEQKLCFLGR